MKSVSVLGIRLSEGAQAHTISPEMTKKDEKLHSQKFKSTETFHSMRMIKIMTQRGTTSH